MTTDLNMAWDTETVIMPSLGGTSRLEVVNFSDYGRSPERIGIDELIELHIGRLGGTALVDEAEPQLRGRFETDLIKLLRSLPEATPAV
jgi:hypothetical protein